MCQDSPLPLTWLHLPRHSLSTGASREAPVDKRAHQDTKHHSRAITENSTTSNRKDKRTTAERKYNSTTAWDTLVGSSTKAACAAVTLESRHTPLHEHGVSPDEEKRLECARCCRARAARCCRARGARCYRARQCGDGACRCCRARAARCYRARPAHVVSRLS